MSQHSSAASSATRPYEIDRFQAVTLARWVFCDGGVGYPLVMAGADGDAHGGLLVGRDAEQALIAARLADRRPAPPSWSGDRQASARRHWQAFVTVGEHPPGIVSLRSRAEYLLLANAPQARPNGAQNTLLCAAVGSRGGVPGTPRGFCARHPRDRRRCRSAADLSEGMPWPQVVLIRPPAMR